MPLSRAMEKILDEQVSKPPRWDPEQASDLPGMINQFLRWVKWSERVRTVEAIKHRVKQRDQDGDSRVKSP